MKIAASGDQSLAQMAVAWLLKDKRVTSVLLGVSKVSQLEDNIEAIKNTDFSQEELKKIDSILELLKANRNCCGLFDINLEQFCFICFNFNFLQMAGIKTL